MNFIRSVVDYVLRFLGLRSGELQRVPTLAKLPGIHHRDIHIVRPVKTVIQDQHAPKLHAFDDLENWGKDFTFTPPLSKVKIEDLQKRFDNAFGLNKRGESCFKLVWSGDRRYWHRFFYDWDGYGKGTKVEERPRVLWKKIDVGNGFYLDIWPPRWLILMRIEPEQYAEQWKSESWVWDGKRQQMKQIRDDEPPKVFWETWEIIGEHDGYCCESLKGECFGAYREPGDRDVEKLGMAKRAFEGGHQSPYEKLNAKTEAEIATFARDYYRQQYSAMSGTSEITIETAHDYLKPLLDFTGEKYSNREEKQIVKEALDRYHTERAEQFEQRLRSE